MSSASLGYSLHQAIIQFGRGECDLEILENAVCKAAHHCCNLNEDHKNILKPGRLLRTLDRNLPTLATGLRGWISIYLKSPPLTLQEWQTAQAAMLTVLGQINLDNSRIVNCQHLMFCADLSTSDLTMGEKSCVLVDAEGSSIPINVGTIASIKGQTHDATLILQTTFSTIKPFGKFAEALKATTTREWGSLESSLLANFYVAATRPRRLLAIAAEASQINQTQRNLMTLSGWNFVEIQAPAPVEPEVP